MKVRVHPPVLLSNGLEMSESVLLSQRNVCRGFDRQE